MERNHPLLRSSKIAEGQTEFQDKKVESNEGGKTISNPENWTVTESDRRERARNTNKIYVACTPPHNNIWVMVLTASPEIRQ